MNLVAFLGIFVFLPSSILCATHAMNKASLVKVIDSKVADSKISNVPSEVQQKSLVKREIGSEFNEQFFPYYGMRMNAMPKRAAVGLNKIIYVLRNSFDKPPSQSDSGIDLRATNNFPGDLTQALTRDTGFDRFPSSLVERRGQTQKDRKTYLRCFWNAVSCF